MEEPEQAGDQLETTLPEIQRPRRSPRRFTSVAVWLRREGSGRTWEEETETRTVSRYGAGLQCRHYLEAGSTVAIVRRDNGQHANARVSYCRYDSEGRREIGIEFLNCENFWEMDWDSTNLVVSHPESLRTPSGPAQAEVAPPEPPPQAEPQRRSRASRLTETLIASERQLWEGLRAQNASALEKLVARDSLWISGAGVQKGAPDLSQALGPNAQDCSLAGFAVKKLGKASAIVTYQSVAPSEDAPQAAAPARVHHASLWVHRGKNWQVVFHQQTRAR